MSELPQERADTGGKAGSRAGAILFFLVALALLGWSAWSSRERKSDPALPQRGMELMRLQNSASPIQNAIRRYERENLRLPGNLKELVPDYLTALPPPTGSAVGEWNYSSGEPDGANGPPGWTLWVVARDGFCPRHPGSSGDVLVYRGGDGVYPEEAYGGKLERIHDWGFYHRDSRR
jgi:hypothetical protein